MLNQQKMFSVSQFLIVSDTKFFFLKKKITWKFFLKERIRLKKMLLHPMKGVWENGLNFFLKKEYG